MHVNPSVLTGITVIIIIHLVMKVAKKINEIENFLNQ